MTTSRKFVLAHHRSPGDIVCLTSAVRDIKLAYGDDVLLDVDTTCFDLWRNNPYLTRLWNHDAKAPKRSSHDVEFLKMGYSQGIRQQNHETMHFASYFHRDFKKHTGIAVPVLYPHGDIHLSDEEAGTPIIEGRYWVVISGGKSDFTIKVWGKSYFQEVVDWLTAQGLGAVQIGSSDNGNWHPKLDGTMNLIGRTNLRDMLRLIYHADGVICGVTGAMHMAAALHRPCVCIAGGREAWWWEAYVNENRGFGDVSGTHPMPHRYLHTIGLLDCCQYHGCWKNKVVKISNDKLLCKYPVKDFPEMPLAKCMEMIRPAHVIEAVMSYYKDGSLPPVKLGAAPPAETAVMLPQAVAAPERVQSKGCPQPAKTVRTNAKARMKLPPGTNIRINPTTKMETRGNHKAAAAAVIPQLPGISANFSDETIFDHPDVGSKFTAFILFYGPDEYHELHRKCLESLLLTIPQDRLDLRVGSNALNQQSLDMIEEKIQGGVITKHYRHDENAYKYPVMREMFFDPTCSITTKWVLWFDDDSLCDVEPAWLNILSRHIIQHHRKDKAHAIGAKFHYRPNPKQWEIFTSRPWYKGKPRRNDKDQPSPSGQHTHFVAGGFWAVTHAAIVGADIPDLGTGLTHNGGDWQIGEQLYQNGYGIKQFNGKKQFVRTSSVPRRGVTTKLIDQVGTGDIVAKTHTTTAVAPQFMPPPRSLPPQPRPPQPRQVDPAKMPKLRVVEL